MARMNLLTKVAQGPKINIHAVDNLSPVSRVAIYVRAGSRYEPNAVPGVSHYVRACAGLTTQGSSIFGITRHMERHGATFKVTSDREYIVYRVDCMRDRLTNVLGFVDDTINKPELRAWELVDVVQPRLKEELGRFKKNQLAVTNEALHKAAYRGGLAHSIFIPEHQIEKLSKKDALDYFKRNFVVDRMSIVGLGVDENELRNNIEGNFSFSDGTFEGVDGATRYVGGEARIQAGFSNTMVNFVVQGSSIRDAKSIASLEVLATLLGGDKQTYVKYGNGPERSLQSLLNRMAPGSKSSMININHTDTGLFGFSLLGQPNEAFLHATKAAVKHIKQVMSNLSEKDLTSAKKATTARSLIVSEDQEAVFNSLGRRHAAGSVEEGPLDHVSKLTLKDVQQVVGNLLKSKPTMVSVGNPRFVPYVDEIDS